MNRPNAAVSDADEALRDFRAALRDKLGERGYGVFVSSHEVFGVIEEEQQELMDAIRDDDLDEIADELLDIMVAAFWGYVSVKSGQMDWPKRNGAGHYAAEYDSV